jgi:cytochrome P450
MKRPNLAGGLAIIAGSDTTSSAMSNLFYYLLTNPKTYKRVQAEVDSIGDNVMDYAKLAHLPYLNASMYVLYHFTELSKVIP